MQTNLVSGKACSPTKGGLICLYTQPLLAPQTTEFVICISIYIRLHAVTISRTHNLCFRAKIRRNVYPCKPQFYYIKWCLRVFTLQMEETFLINLADDDESDSSDVDIDIAGCDFYQRRKKKHKKEKNNA